MNKVWRVILILLTIILVAGIALFAMGYFKPKQAGILVETSPVSLVYLDGIQVGRTPYETTRQPGEITLKLIPETVSQPLVPFETKAVLVSGIKTVVRRELAETEETSAGEIVSFEKISGSETSLAIVSSPESAQVSIDGRSMGFAPYKTSSLVAGEHQVTVLAEGYLERSLMVRTLSGYKLTLIVKLARTAVLPTPTPTPTPAPKEMVEILETPGGFLRVRQEPRTTSPELARVKPEDKFEVIEEDEETGWFKIEYTAGNQGWISNQYARILP